MLREGASCSSDARLGLVSHDHRIDFVDGDGEDRPEDGRQEKAADDIDYSVGIEQARCGAAMGAAAGEAFEP